jgi:hypothetical protein
MRKEKIMVPIFPDEIVLGNSVIMRFSVHLCQRKFLNKHLRFSIHVSHISFIPPLVVKSYAPCFCHTKTFPVLLVMSPVHTIRDTRFRPSNLHMKENTCMDVDMI